jgi:CPA1 family monovalent cation:H+ antiporter
MGVIMEVFNYVLILLVAVLLSNVINRFLPMLSVPIVQIVLGVSITLIPHSALNYDFELEPELFFVLFLSPLIFNSARTANLKVMQKLIYPIIMTSVVLLLISVFVTGYLTHFMIPAIPLAAAFALAAALGPLDLVAVEAVAHRIKLPQQIFSMLMGESYINDASAIVCFQLAIVAAATGSFNFFHGFVSFTILSIGGLLVGIVFTVLKFILIRWLRSLSLVTASLHLSIGILTPFIIYLIAEELGTSGILAVFSAGIVHAIYKDKLNPEVLALTNATENIWSFLAFSLDGLVFVMLGAHLPAILRLETGRASGYGGRQIILFVILIYLSMAVARFVWWIATLHRKTRGDSADSAGIIRSGLIFGVAGARGAVSMAGVLSVPLLLVNGDAFPERELIILIACGVIVLSLLMTNFVLPLLVPKGNQPDMSLHEKEQAARVEILQTVIKRLKEAITPENIAATEVIIHHYYARMNKQFKEQDINGRWRSLGIRNGFFFFFKDVILHMAEIGQLDENQVEHYVDEVNRLHNESLRKMGMFKSFLWITKHLYSSLTWKETMPKKRDMRKLKEINKKIMKEKQKEFHLAKDDPALKIIALEHEKVVSARMRLLNNEGGHMENRVNEVAESGLYMERVLIQQMMEAGRLSHKTAKEMQANIILLEAQLHAETE